MFEGSFSETGFQEAAVSGAQRTLEWPILVAKLSAARELRVVFAQRRIGTAGNFTSFSETRTKVLKNSGSGVNLDALADRKCSGVTMPDTANEAQSGNRES
jgi:hypothetical protein